MAESEEELNSLLMKAKEESETAGLEPNIQKKKKMTMASSPITSLQKDAERMETVTDLILGAPKITADSDCSHEIKRRLFLGRKAMANVDNVLKSRDTTLPTKVSICTTMVFPSSHVWM